MSTQNGGTSGFAYLKRELATRISAPAGEVTFWLYLFSGVLVLGGFGVWYEFFPYVLSLNGSSAAGVYSALLTFFPALAGPAALQMVFTDVEKPLKAFAIAYCVLFLGLFTLLTLGKPEKTWLSFLVVGIACLTAIFMWWITNGHDPAFRDNVDDKAPLGGDTQVTPKGSLDGFEV